ncbi:hypothetical protein PJ311_16170 [Bacillus sp. CLL-7-23]|uniref:Uncharacterized protein n=1 Tax=Bacillus changyiensis TaxID=3004103 RepID=A0ABT4X765_9BACI|nr:hypothetical protein [Bacillus changyiensis]MDA7028111.1 hypothetical protein [Bacillus changyiensis]
MNLSNFSPSSSLRWVPQSSPSIALLIWADPAVPDATVRIVPAAGGQRIAAVA